MARSPSLVCSSAWGRFFYLTAVCSGIVGGDPGRFSGWGYAFFCVILRTRSINHVSSISKVFGNNGRFVRFRLRGGEDRLASWDPTGPEIYDHEDDHRALPSHGGIIRVGGLSDWQMNLYIKASRLPP